MPGIAVSDLAQDLLAIAAGFVVAVLAVLLVMWRAARSQKMD